MGDSWVISRHRYSWERPSRGRDRRPFYLRWWFYVPVGLVVLGVAGAWIGWMILSATFEGKAEAYDLAQMETMEAASVIYDRTGQEIGKIFIQNRHPVPLDRISPMMVKAVIAAEDNKFYQHKGVDYMGVVRAMVANYRRGKISQGASTVTQQLARNTFELRERTYQRKLVEMFLSHRIEKNFSKDKIMELYLNRVYFGSGLYGVEAAARGYFGRNAKDLTAGQCAMLAGLLKSPQALSPWNNKEAAEQNRNFVLKRMKDEGFLNGAQLKEETGIPLFVVKRTNPFKVSYAIDYIRQQVIAALGFDRALNGGFRIETTLDLDMQKAAESSLRDILLQVEQRPGYNHATLEAYRKFTKPIEDQINNGNMTIKMPEPRYLQGAVMALENATGGVLVLVGGRDFKHSEYNRATMSRRPPGTAFAPFVFAAAYESGIFPGEIVEDACFDNRYVMVGGDSGILGEWGVEREDNEYEGGITTRRALSEGKNAATVRLGLRIGVDAVRKVSAGAGLASPLRNYANAFLGSSEMTLEELTLGYTVFPNGGVRPKQPHIVRRIIDSAGQVIVEAKSGMVKALSPEAAWQVHAGLVDALRTGTGAQAATKFGLKDFPAAGKTGTAYNFTDTWFLGYDSSVTCGVWVGFDRPAKIFRGAFGKDLALPVWTRVMNAAAQDFPARDIPPPESLKPVEICAVSGLLAAPKCGVLPISDGHGGGRPGTYQEFGTEAEIPAIRCDVHGGGIRNYAKEYGQEEWPRPVFAVDLSTIRPVAVSAPTLLGLNDVYGSVRPAAERFDDSIPVQRAIPVGADETSVPPAEGEEPVPAGEAVAAVPVAEPEVRKAEAVKPLDSPFDAPAASMPTPPPIDF